MVIRVRRSAFRPASRESRSASSIRPNRKTSLSKVTSKSIPLSGRSSLREALPSCHVSTTPAHPSALWTRQDRITRSRPSRPAGARGKRIRWREWVRHSTQSPELQTLRSAAGDCAWKQANPHLSLYRGADTPQGASATSVVTVWLPSVAVMVAMETPPACH